MPVNRIFPLGVPVEPQDVLHAPTFLKEVTDRLWDGQSVMIAGPRRVGKSSAAYEVLRRLRERGAYIVSVDLFYAASLDELGAQLLQAVLANRTGPINRALRVFHDVKEWIQTQDVRVKVSDLDLSLSFSHMELGGEESVEAAFALGERLATKDEKHLVILLDEFQELDRLGGPPLIKKLRALFQQQKHTTYLFLGSQAGLMHTIFSDQRQAFYRFAVMLNLPEIPEATWRSYLTEKFAGLHITISEGALGELFRETGRHPYSVMAVASTAYYLTRSDSLTTIDREMMYYALERTLDLLEEIFQDHWEEVRKYRHAALVFRAVIQGNPPYATKIHPNQVHEALAYLQRIAVLRKGSHRGEYHLIEPLFGRWFQRTMG